MNDITDIPYSNEELQDSDINNKIEKLMQFFDEYGLSYEKYEPEKLPKLKLDPTKTAYPNFDYFINSPGQHNLDKWLTAIKDIYYKEKNGINRRAAIKSVVSQWSVTEVFDFLNWLKFYEEGTHMKYKTAQLWYENGAPGYFLHVKKNENEENSPSTQDIAEAKDAVADEFSPSEKKRIIEKQRSKIIGRLDSAEKLLRTPEGQLFAGKELETLIESIYSLKKKIHLVNKISSSVRLYEDMIIREANILVKKGFVNAGQHLTKIAQNIGGPVPTPTPPAPPAQGSGNVGGLPAAGPGMPQTAPPNSSPNENPESGIKKFLENLDTGNLTTKEDKNNLEVHDDVLEIADGSDLLVTEAQAASTKPIATELSKENVKKPELEIKEEDISKNPKSENNTNNFDSILDSAFANLTVNDVVNKLEDLAKIFKVREVPRQLAIVDMMLDSLGLASFFPSLSEATNKSLESNNYISTRVEDILSKLRGAMESRDIDLRGNDNEHPEVTNIKNKLQQDSEKEKARKKMRKEQENAELDFNSKETPDIEMEDLAPHPTNAPAVPPPAPKA